MGWRRWSGVVLACLGVFALSGCGSFTRKIAVGQMVPILENATEGARERTDLHLVSQAIPANLLLVDGLIRTDPKNKDLLTVSSFLHFGYALGFVEPDSLELASQYYATGRDHGLQALEHRKPFARNRDGTLEEFERGLASVMRTDVPALAWATANWGRWISLNLESPAAVAQQPRLEAMLNRLLVLDPEFEAGLPHVLRGMLDSMRPEMLGGRPDSAQAHFQKAFALAPGANMLYYVFYAEYYCRQVLDEACFDTTLDEVEKSSDTGPPQFRLMNEIARRRAKALRARKDELF